MNRLILLSIFISFACAKIHAQDDRMPSRTFRHAYVAAGVGLPELFHISAGYFLHPRLSLDAHYGNVIFNHMVGIGATGLLLGEASASQPKHSLLLSTQFRINPKPRPLTLTASGETLGGMAELYAGYAYIADKGFILRAMVGALLYPDRNGFAGGPNFKIALGGAFF